MATVYLAQDLKHDRKVALKVLRPELAATLGSERFLQEIRIAASLTHPHILPVHDSGEADGVLYYVMPFIDGESLRDRLVRELELPIPDAVSILREVVDGLICSHGMGVVHRDIQPANILLSGRHAMIADFGVAKAVTEATGRNQLTTMGVALGTPSYMSPEQAAADENIDHRADIYAIGAVAYELLTGRPRFLASSPQAVLTAHVTKQPEPVSEHRASVPPALEAFVMRCLEKKPADRWQTAEEMLDQLTGLAATPSGGLTPTALRPVEVAQPRNRLGGRLTAAAIVLVLGAAAVVAVQGRGSNAVVLGPTTRITREAELEIDPALSPDGSMLAYASGVGGRFSIVVRQVDGGRPIPLTDVDGGDQRRPKWSPDRTRILYQSTQVGEGSSIYWAPALGGVPSLVARPPAANPAWSLSGDSIAYLAGSSLMVRAVDGGQARTVVDGLGDPHALAWLSRRLIAFVDGESGEATSEGGAGVVGMLGPTELSVVPSGGGEAIQLSNRGPQEMSPVWGGDGRFLWFVSSRLGSMDVWRMPIARSGEAGGPAEPITNGLQIQAISLAAGRLAYAEASLRSNMLVL